VTADPARPLRVGIQGGPASFHDLAARRHHDGCEIETVPCTTFRELCRALRGGRADRCVMAVENTIAGSLLPNYALLEEHAFRVVGEIYQRIELSLMALPGQSLEELTVVRSHPMALLQCVDFLEACPHLTVLEGTDTAESAADVRRGHLVGHAAIASARAAELYDLAIVRAGIETNKQNYTRFLVLADGPGDEASGANKESVRFTIPHRAGCLADVLDILRDHDVNLTKLQSLPIVGRPYEYSFHADLEWEDRPRYEAAISRTGARAASLVRYGAYPRAPRPEAP
jgi:prephenate dehydratase